MQRLQRADSGRRGGNGGGMGGSGGMDKSMLPGHNPNALSAKLEATRAAFKAAQVGIVCVVMALHMLRQWRQGHECCGSACRQGGEARRPAPARCVRALAAAQPPPLSGAGLWMGGPGHARNRRCRAAAPSEPPRRAAHARSSVDVGCVVITKAKW